jgi:iron(III) transport system ATP-binding protein
LTSRYRISTPSCVDACAKIFASCSTVGYVTHDQEEALAVSDRIIVMQNGRIAQDGTPVELYEQPASLFVADFIGDANLVDAVVIEERGERGLVRVGGIDIDLPRRNAPKGPVKLAIRPEAIALHGAKPAEPALAGRVTKASYLGKHLEYSIETPIGALFVVDRVRAKPLVIGNDAWMTFTEKGAIVVPA